MSSTRRRALTAGVALIGTEGIRALTHARVDAAAELPLGSTSNHFRTRAALLSGIITWIAEQERAEAGDPGLPTTEAELVAMLTAMIHAETGPLITRTRARFALFLEASDPDALAPLRVQRGVFEDWIRSAVISISGPESAAGVPLLMASCDGLILHRVTIDPDLPIDAAVAAAVRTALTAADVLG